MATDKVERAARVFLHSEQDLLDNDRLRKETSSMTAPVPSNAWPRPL